MKDCIFCQEAIEGDYIPVHRLGESIILYYHTGCYDGSENDEGVRRARLLEELQERERMLEQLMIDLRKKPKDMGRE